MNTSYQVRIWDIKPRRNRQRRITSYSVRWKVESREFFRTFKVRAQADSFRAELLSAQRAGERFSTTTGMPSSMGRTTVDMTWFELTCGYVDTKWPDLAATARQTVAEALIRVLPVFVPDKPGRPDAKTIRSVARQWGYNTAWRANGQAPDAAQRVLEWLRRNTSSVRTAFDPDVLRELQRAVTRRLDGTLYAPTVARKTRSVLWNTLDYAVELGLIDSNPLAGVKWTSMPKGKRKVDRRAVPNPVQARTILQAVRTTGRSGERLEAFFGAMYFAGLRPEEATALCKRNLTLPPAHWNSKAESWEYGWGTLYLEQARPYIDARWTNDGTVGELRQLKSRAVGDGRAVPCPPELTGMLWRHIERFGFGEDGRVFSGERGGEVSKVTYTKVWRAARAAALTEEAQRTPLARRPYDLRHAAVSTWLAAGVAPARVADWAGHSVAVLYEIYASFLDGGEQAARQQVEAALGTLR